MIKIGGLQLGRIPGIALSVSDREDNGKIKKSGADLLELRVDSFSRLDGAYVTAKIKERKKNKLPLILTIRSKKEGGRVNLSDEARLFLFASLVELVDAVDIELKSSILKDVVKLAKKNKKILIVSLHDFKATPLEQDLEAVLKKARQAGADIVKIALKANSAEDVLRLMSFTVKHKSGNLITISLGQKGLISRVFSLLCGSLFTYSYLSHPFAPGQVSQSELLRQIRLYYR